MLNTFFSQYVFGSYYVGLFQLYICHLLNNDLWVVYWEEWWTWSSSQVDQGQFPPPPLGCGVLEGVIIASCAPALSSCSSCSKEYRGELGEQEMIRINFARFCVRPGLKPAQGSQTHSHRPSCSFCLRTKLLFPMTKLLHVLIFQFLNVNEKKKQTKKKPQTIHHPKVERGFLGHGMWPYKADSEKEEKCPFEG